MSNRSDRVRVGVIGCGRVSWERHLQPLLANQRLRVTATADLDAERSRQRAQQLGAPRSFTDYRQLLDCEDVDAVAVLTPTGSHAEIGLAALDAGKHLLMEKPLALNVGDCDRLIARASQSRCKVVVGYNLRWHRLVRQARGVLEQGTLGRIKAIRSVYTHNRSGENAPDWHRALALGGGVCFNEAVHHFDLWRYLLGNEVEQVYSLSAPSAYYEDETSVITARLAQGVLASGTFTFQTGPNSEVEIYGEAGRLCLSMYRFDGLEFFPSSGYPGNLSDRLVKTLAAVSALPSAIPIMRKGGDFQATFDGLWNHFLDCILRDEPPQYAPWKMAGAASGWRSP